MALNAATLLTILDNIVQRPFMDKLSTENVNHVNELNRKTRERVQAFQAKEAPILADRSKSDEGKSAALASVATKSIADFKYLEVVSMRERDTIARLTATLFTIPMPTTMTEQDAREIRGEYLNLSAQEVDMSFLRTCELSTVADPDDVEAQPRATEELFAILGKRGRSLVSLDIKQRGLSERAKQLFPTTFAELQQAEILFEQLSGLRDYVVNWLTGLGADPQQIHDQLGGPQPTISPMARELAKRQVAA